jgi:hypothetical protein
MMKILKPSQSSRKIIKSKSISKMDNIYKKIYGHLYALKTLQLFIY